MTAEAPYGGAAVSLKCNSWTCEECAPGRVAQVIRQCLNGDPNKFVTLTSHRAPGKDPINEGRKLVKAARTFIRLLRKQHPTADIQAFFVFEATKRGWPHLHILMRAPFIAKAWLSALMKRLMDSPIVDIKRVDGPKNIARYVAKYLGKAPHKFGTLKRYWQTKGWQTAKQKDFERAFPKGLAWEQRNLPYSVFLEDWRRYGYPVRELAPGVAIWGTFSEDHLARAAVGWAIRAGPPAQSAPADCGGGVPPPAPSTEVLADAAVPERPGSAYRRALWQ